MGERSSETHGNRPVLLCGAGRRARETGAVLSVLSALDAQGARGAEPFTEVGLDDLEELLAPRLHEGWLILESGRVPAEDIGFVRRFLERHPLWRLLVLGEESEARGLLALARSQWLTWPPSLEDLRALLAQPAPKSAPAESGEREATQRPARRSASPTAAPPGASATAPANGSVDVAGLLEELLASASLEAEGSAGSPRYLFRSSEPHFVPVERRALQAGLSGVVELARHCALGAGNDGLVRGAVAERGDGVLVGIEFPRGALAEKDLPGLLEKPFPGEADPRLAEGVAAAQRGADLLRAAGGRIELLAAEPGRLRCEIRLAHEERPAPRPARAKPEDPFA